MVRSSLIWSKHKKIIPIALGNYTSFKKLKYVIYRVLTLRKEHAFICLKYELLLNKELINHSTITEKKSPTYQNNCDNFFNYIMGTLIDEKNWWNLLH